MTSVGIDIGTSTLQCVFSSLVLENLSPAFAVPRVELTDKRVLYRAPLRLTPLLTPDTIDGAAVAKGAPFQLKSDWSADHKARVLRGRMG